MACTLKVLRQFRKNTKTPFIFGAAACHYSNEVNILKSPFPDVDIPNTTLPEFVFSNADRWPNHIALECGVTGRKYTYDQLRIGSRNLGGNLRKKLNLQRGDVVALLMPNCPEFAFSSLAAIQAGLIVTTLNPLYTPDEICRQLKDCNAKAIIAPNVLSNLAQASAALTQKTIPIISFPFLNESESISNGSLNLRELIENKTDLPKENLGSAEDVVVLPYSSGTTGLPKGVELSHKNIVACITQVKLKEYAVCQDATNEYQDVVPIILPQFHIYGMTINTYYALHRGSKLVTLPKFTPELFVSTLAKHRATILFLAPPLVLFLTGHNSVTKDHLSSIRTVVSGAAPLGALDEEKFKRKAEKDINIRQGYGLTESSPSLCMSCSELPGDPAGSVGPPIPNTLLKIVSLDDVNKNLPANSTGEILVKGPQVMKQYFQRPKETKETFHNGWLRTGDVGYYNDDKNVFLTDRLKELIKVKGFQVPPAELEEIIRDFPAVAEAGVIGIPHEKYGEVPRAYVVPKPGQKINENSLKEFVEQKVANYKRLVGGVCVIDSLPKNTTGKILRRQLLELYKSKST